MKLRTKGRGILLELARGETLPVSNKIKLKKILVPVDFSECSNKAVSYALPFAELFEAQVILLHILQPYRPIGEEGVGDWASYEASLRIDGQSRLASMRSEISAEIEVNTEIRRGHPAQEIVNAADEFNCDLIILSTHGRTGLKRLVLGSVSEHVIRYAHCPVLTVREREHDFIAAGL